MRNILVVLISFWCATSFAQERFSLSVNLVNSDAALLKSLTLPSDIKDSLTVYKEAEKLISQLQGKGFLLAEIKNISFEGMRVQLLINQNAQYKWVNLAAGNLPKDLKRAVGFKEESYQNASFDSKRLQQLFKLIIAHYENNGYPFANVSLDSIGIGKSAISASIKVRPYQKFVFDTIQIVGSAQISQKYLQSYLNIKEGSAYKESSIKQVENRLRELPFLQVVKNSEIEFSVEKAVVRVFVNKKNANQFDGVLGLQQNTSTNKSQLVGDLKLHLQNTLKVGEQLDFNYQGLAGQSQLLAINLSIPHVLNTSFGLSPRLYLYKQDSSFVNVDTKLGFNYLLKGNNTFQIFVENKSTSLVGVDAYQNATVLPSILDASTFFYGLGLTLEDLDYRFNPQKGYDFVINLAVGDKRIKRNSAIPEQLYSGIPLKSTSYSFFSQINYYKSLSKNLVLALGSQSAFLNGKYLLENELFRLGGQKSLRGFNEFSLLATSYIYGNAELRYLLAQNSFLFAFYNQAYLKRETSQLSYSDYPLGFGTGVNFETNIGILSVSYALGKQRNNPLNLRQGKIHFGITALF